MGERRSGKFGVRIRKMKPQPITVKRRRRQAWGKYEKKEETVLGTLLVSLICFQIFCISRKNRYVESDDDGDNDESATTTNPSGPAQTGGNTAAGSNGSFSSAIVDGPTDYDHAVPNFVRVLEYGQSSSTLEYPDDVSSPLPGAVGEADPPAVVAAISAPTSLPLVAMQQAAAAATAEGQVLNLGDLELTGLPSRESLSAAPTEQKHENDKKQKKKDKKKKKDSKKMESKEKRAAVEKKKKSSKAKDKKKSSKAKEDPSSKIPSMKEWAKQEEKKKKAEKKQQKSELKQEKLKQKQMEKLAAKVEKQKKAQKLKKEKEIKKAEKEVEKEAAKAKKAAEKAEKTIAKAKEAAAKAEAKKREKHSKWERRMQQMLEESDKQMAADLERERIVTEERKRKREELQSSTPVAAH